MRGENDIMTVKKDIFLSAHEWSKLFSLREQLREFSNDLWDDADEKELSGEPQFLNLVTSLEDSLDKLDFVLGNYIGG